MSGLIDDPRLALYRGIGDAELMREHGLFVAEGRLVVRRVLEDRRFRVRSCLLNEAARAALGDALAHLTPDVPVFVRDTSHFEGLTGFHIHRGCLALVERPAPLALADAVAGARTVVVLEGVTDADNVGSIFRNAAALGGDAVVLSPACCDPLYRKAIRTSMGAVLHVPFARAAEWPQALDALRQDGFVLAALTPDASAEALDAFVARTRQARVAWLAGTEGAGLTREAEARADVRVRVPMRPGVDSLNVATAVGIGLYERGRSLL